MKKITTIDELKQSILELEVKQANEAELLKAQFKTTYESLKPANLIKNIFHDLTSSPDLKGGIVDTALSMGAGYLSKKIAVGSTHNPIKQVLGALIQMGVTGVVSKNSEGIKSTLINLISRFINRKKTNS